MFKKITLFYLLLFVNFNVVASEFEDLPQSSSSIYPQYISFRKENTRGGWSNYDQWRRGVEGSIAVNRKFVSEEVEVDPRTAGWAVKWAGEGNNNLTLLHLNGEQRQVVSYPEVLDRYFPGHWIYEAGTTIVDKISSTDVEVIVDDSSIFTTKGYVNRRTTPFTWYAQHVVIVHLDESGNRDWYNCEFATIKAVDHDCNKITIKRATINSTPKKFDAGSYIAPISGDVWGGEVMLYYNFSTDCPKDEDGQTAAQLYSAEIGGWFEEGGPLGGFSGVAFDVNYFDSAQKHPRWDTNNDGVADGGWVDGVNCWRDGDWQFLKMVREQLGPDRLITCDGHHPHNQQAVGVLNGIESEGLVQHNDAWRGISRAFNTHIYWRDMNPLSSEFRYTAMKYMNPDDMKNVSRLSRFQVAVSSCLEAYVTTNILSEGVVGRDFLPEEYRENGAFGGVRGGIVRVAKEGEDWFSSLVNNPLSLAKGDNCECIFEDNKLRVRSLPANRDSVMRFRIKNIDIPKGDVTLFVKTKAVDPLEGFTKSDFVPRIMWLTISGLPEIKNQTERTAHHNIYGLFGTHRTEDISYYFRNRIDDGAGEIEIVVQGRGEVEIESIELYQASDIIMRRFENVTIIANPSLDEQSVECDGRRYIVPAVDAIFVK